MGLLFADRIALFLRKASVVWLVVGGLITVALYAKERDRYDQASPDNIFRDMYRKSANKRALIGTLITLVGALGLYFASVSILGILIIIIFVAAASAVFGSNS